MQGGINANNSMRSKHTAEDCLARVPYASVMAFFMSVVGVLLFSVMMARAFNASIEQTKRLFNNDELPFLSKVIFFIENFYGICYFYLVNNRVVGLESPLIHFEAVLDVLDV